MSGADPNRRSMTKPICLAVVALVLTPSVVFADCYVTWNCGVNAACTQAYQVASGRNGPFPSCSGFKQTDLVSRCDCSPSSPSSAIPVGPTPLQQVQMDVARQVGASVGKALADALMGNPQQDAANQAEALRAQQAAAQAAEQQRQIDEQRIADISRQQEAAKQRILGMLKGTEPSTSLSLKTADLEPSTGGDELKLKLGGQTQFFGTNAPKCPPSQDASTVDLCGRGATVDPATIKMDPSTASIGGAGLTTGQADAIIRPTPAQSSGATTRSTTISPQKPQTSISQDFGLSKDSVTTLVPLLRQPVSSVPIGKVRPAICESLSRQLDETYQLARRALLASDVYTHNDLNDPVSISLQAAGFDRISDAVGSSDMRRLFPGMSNQRVKDLLEPADSDYRAAIYRDRTDPTKIFLVFRGTSTLGDWKNGNFPQAAGLGSTYYDKAIFLTHVLKTSTASYSLGLEIVGHSMGGGMADAAGVANKITTTSFNPSGVNPNTIKGADLSSAHQYLTDYVVDGEPLNMHQDHPALTRVDAVAISTIAAPLVPAVLAVGAAAGDPEQSLRELVALESTSLPRAIGRRVTLAPDPQDLHSASPFRLHVMDGVIDAIAAQSHELYAQYGFNECGS
jgi:hypothetical protein